MKLYSAIFLLSTIAAQKEEEELFPGTKRMAKGLGCAYSKLSYEESISEKITVENKVYPVGIAYGCVRACGHLGHACQG